MLLTFLIFFLRFISSMFICALCSFAATRERDWERHEARTGHTLAEDNLEASELSFSDTNDSDQDDARDMSIQDDARDMSIQEVHSPEIDHSDDHESPNDSPTASEHSDDVEFVQQDPWFPFKSRAHFYMVLIYHGSHQKNFDQATLHVILDVFKMYVPETEYFPSFDDVVHFKHEFWEEKILESRVLDENVWSFLRPEGIIALRLSHPVFSKSFDRVPRQNFNNIITTQSSAEKFKKFEFRKLGDLLKGDLVKLDQDDTIAMHGYPHKVPCQMYFLITDFYIQDNEYKVNGKYFFHSSLPEMTTLRDRVGNNDCFIQVVNIKEPQSFNDLRFNLTMRSQNQDPRFSRFTYNEAFTEFITVMPELEYQKILISLQDSVQEGCVQVVCNLHIDDASQVQSKMWKSASVFDIQIAGAPAGFKGSEYNNIILSLTDTSKISLKRLFDGVCGEFTRLERDGFECYDDFTGKIEKVKIPIGAVLGDLPAKAEITPFTGES
jgi:hypothetical protein